MALALAILVIFLGYALFYYWTTKWSRSAKLINAVPGPLMYPLIGSVYKYALKSDLWKAMRDVNAQFYPISRIWMLFIPIVNIYHADDVEAILSSTKEITKGGFYEYLKAWFGTGLLTSTGSKWQKRRKILTPAFHFNVLKEFMKVFVKEADCMVESLKESGEAVTVNLVKFVSEHTLNTLCETAMGTSLKDKGEFQFKYRNAVHDMGEIFTQRSSSPWLYMDFIFNRSRRGVLQKKLLKILHDFTRKIIEERKDYHDSTNGIYLQSANSTGEGNEGNAYKSRKKGLAMLDLLIAAQRDGNQIDDEGIREEVDTFMFEGHDTSAMAISFILMRLAEHKEIQDRVRAEVDQIFHENGSELTMAAVQNMQYLERCIKESLRLHPSVPFIARCLTDDFQLNKYLLPAGLRIHIHIYELHRDPNFWPNPHVFDPDRFLPENSKGRHPYCYVPFSAGPRNCIGQKFALLEIKIMIANILKHFYLEPVDGIKDVRMTADLVYRPAHPIYLRFVPIK